MVAAFLWPSYGYRQRPMAAALNCCSQAASYFGKKMNRKKALYTVSTANHAELATPILHTEVEPYFPCTTY